MSQFGFVIENSLSTEDVMGKCVFPAKTEGTSFLNPLRFSMTLYSQPYLSCKRDCLNFGMHIFIFGVQICLTMILQTWLGDWRNEDSKFCSLEQYIYSCPRSHSHIVIRSHRYMSYHSLCNLRLSVTRLSQVVCSMIFSFSSRQM